MTTPRPARMPAIALRADPNLIARARLGLMLPANATVSEVVRAALQLAAGAETPDGQVSRGGWRPRREQREHVDPSTMRVRHGLRDPAVPDRLRYVRPSGVAAPRRGRRGGAAGRAGRARGSLPPLHDFGCRSAVPAPPQPRAARAAALAATQEVRPDL